eukprot:TRINITY_DN1646_c0_g1_i8.p1 TRINITY_DN1646_c0_g1~~TRINITY_DN1646_c0_g1_i8.p1  ORF type:complete len:176 (-),score=68.60 TRINITY_DN1646_c0_g1_i8:171-698(-)
MCIRDRYQRRVHGGKNIFRYFKQIQQKVIDSCHQKLLKRQRKLFQKPLKPEPRLVPKKKWTSGTKKEKKDMAVFFDEARYQKLEQECAKMKLITVSALMDKLRITGSLARLAIRHLKQKNLIKQVGDWNTHQLIFTTTVTKQAPKVEGNEKKAAPQKGKQQKKGKKEEEVQEEEQ